MRVPSWMLTGWVVLMVITTVAGSYIGYHQARDRTREVNDVAPLGDDNLVDILKLVAGLEDPDLDKVLAPPDEHPTLAVLPTLTPTLLLDNPPSATPSNDDTTTPVPTTTQPDSPTAAPTTAPIDPRRVNILLLGIDQRQGEQGPFRTDTIMVLSLYPAGNSGVMLSIPRDLYVQFPGGLGEDRINNANVVGEQQAYPGGGPELAKRTVSRVLGVPIHYYLMVNFDAFITLIDAIGPVEVCPPERIDDPRYPDGSYGYKHVVFEPGCQDLGAERLLEYARTRRTEGGDIDRAARQQEVILGIREKVMSVGGATALVGDAFTIWESVADNVRTDMTLEQMITLALIAENIPLENIEGTSISYSEVEFGTGPNGEEVLIPIPSDIIALSTELFH